MTKKYFQIPRMSGDKYFWKVLYKFIEYFPLSNGFWARKKGEKDEKN